MNIKTVTVIGANGTMGCNVSAIFASFGNARVYMAARTQEKAETAVERAVLSVRASSIRKNLIPVGYDSLPKCVAESDFVFESVREDLETKLDIVALIEPYLKKDAVVATGSSGLSITKIAEAYPESFRARCFGVHFFNPPYMLTLCELVSTEYSDPLLRRELFDYLKKILRRTVVEVKDKPAFLGNRIGFQFINRALIAAEKYRACGGIDYIDSILGGFSGRSMAPLATADFVGLDVHKAIVDNLYENTSDFAHEDFILPSYVQDLIDRGNLGRKSCGGLYKVVRKVPNEKTILVYDIENRDFREAEKYHFAFSRSMVSALREGSYAEAMRILLDDSSNEAGICLDFMLQYIVYSVLIADQVGFSVHGGDDVMATGFNWCPPLAIVQAFSEVTDFHTLLQERLDPQLQKKISLDKVFSLLEPSRYDFRRYLRATR